MVFSDMFRSFSFLSLLFYLVIINSSSYFFSFCLLVKNLCSFLIIFSTYISSFPQFYTFLHLVKREGRVMSFSLTMDDLGIERETMVTSSAPLWLFVCFADFDKSGLLMWNRSCTYSSKKLDQKRAKTKWLLILLIKII